MKLIDFVNLCQDRVRERTLLLSISHVLEKIGIKIVPYYITREFPCNDVELNLEPKLKPVTCKFLSSSEIKELYSRSEIRNLSKEAGIWQESGCLCFALKYDRQYAAYMWCNLRECNSDLSAFPLNGGEAHIFRTRTIDAYRGKNLAPF